MRHHSLLCEGAQVDQSRRQPATKVRVIIEGENGQILEVEYAGENLSWVAASAAVDDAGLGDKRDRIEDALLRPSKVMPSIPQHFDMTLMVIDASLVTFRQGG